MDDGDHAGPSRRQVEGEEVDADWLKLVKLHQDVSVSERFSVETLPQECNLLAISNIYGLIIVGGPTYIAIHRLSEFHQLLDTPSKDSSHTSTPLQTIQLAAQPVWIRLGCNEERLMVATANGSGLYVYQLADVLRGSKESQILFTEDMPSDLLDVLSNPAPSSSDPYSKYLALLGKDALIIGDMDSRSLATPISGPFTCGCWSPKGRQIVVGSPDGMFKQYTTDGAVKAELPPPPELDTPGAYPTFVQWLENDLFMVAYAGPDASPEDSLEMYIIQRTKSEVVYSKFFDPLDTMGLPGRSGLYRYFSGLQSWGSRTKALGFLMSGLASEVAIFHRSEESSSWENLILGETARATMPTGKKGMSEDTVCLGLALDLTVTKPVSRGIQGGVELPDLPPAPRLMVYSQNGVIVSFDVQYPDGGAYPGMVKPQDVLTATSTSTAASAGAETTPSTNQQTPTFAAQGNIAPNSTSPASGFSGFGQPSVPSTSPSASPFTATPSATGTGFAGFGSANASSTSSAVETTNSGSAFSQTAFGQEPGSSAKPTAFGQTPFGRPTLSTASTTPFGTPAKATSGAAFGQSGFGQGSKPAAFGQSTFGQSSTPQAPATAFRQPSFGQDASQFGSASPSAFGATGTPPTGGFGAFSGMGSSKPAGSGFGASSFGQSTSNAVSGQSAKPIGFGAGGASGSAFGTSSAFAPKSFGQSGFGQSSFGQSNFGNQAAPKAAGTGFAGFGQSSAKPSGFSGFGPAKSASMSTSTSASPSPAPSLGVDSQAHDDFGLGGFASALSTSTAKPVPGLTDDSPPTSPVLGAMQSRKPAGLDDSPPNSPPLLSQTRPITQTAPTNSSFIKPATAFGGSTSSFGGFGTPSKTSAFGSTSTLSAFGGFSTTPASDTTKPAAFSTPPVASSTPASGGVAFGQSSALKPGFGSGSTFGQTSQPSAFGQPSVPASGGFGNISGGFGGFAAKSASPTKTTGTSGGFGGFAAASPGASVFGNKADQPTASAFSNAVAVPEKTPQPAEKQTSEETAVSPLPASGDADSDKPSTVPTATDTSATEDDTEEEGVAGYDVPSSPAPPVRPEPAILPPRHDTAFQPERKVDSGPGTATVEKAAAIPLPEAETPLAEAPPADVHSPDPDDDGVIVSVGSLAGAFDNDFDEEDDNESDGGDDQDVVEEAAENEGEVEEAPGGEVFDQGVEEADEDELEEEDYDEEDDEYDDEDDYEEEGEDEGAEEEVLEMAPIQEEDEEEEEDDDDTTPTKADFEASGSKSPPTWFSNAGAPSDQIHSPSPASASTPEGASLHSRIGSVSPTLGAAGSSQPPKFTLLNKYAARTASPLGIHPPQTLDTAVIAKPRSSTSPHRLDTDPKPSSIPSPAPNTPTPAAIVTSSTDATGESPVNSDTTRGAHDVPETDSKSLFTGFSAPKPSTSASGAPSAPAALAQKPAFDFGLGKKPAPPAVEAVQGGSSAQWSKPAFSFGLGKPPLPSAVTPGSGSASSLFAQSPIAAKSIPPAQSSFFGTPSGAKLPSAPSPESAKSASTPTPFGAFTGLNPQQPERPVVVEPVKPAVAPASPPATSFTTPTRQAVPPTPISKGQADSGMAAVLDGMVKDLQTDLRQLESTIVAATRYHITQTTSFAQISAKDLARHQVLPFSTVPQVSSIAQTLLCDLTSALESKTSSETQLAGLQSQSMKTDLKVGQLKRYEEIERKSETEAAVVVKELDAEQSAAQIKLRHTLRSVETRLDELEEMVTRTRRRFTDGQNGSSAASEMSELQTSLKDIELGIKDRQENLEDLTQRIRSMRLSTPAIVKEQITFGSPTPTVIPSHVAFKVPSDVQAQVRKAMDSDPINDWVKQKGIRQTRVTVVNPQSRSSRKPIDMDALPAPGELPSKPDQKPSTGTTPVPPGSPELGAMRQTSQTFPSIPTASSPLQDVKPETTGSPASPFSFSGISFSLDPGQITSQPRSSGSAARASNSNRKHSAAPRISGEPALGSSPAPGGGFSFALPGGSAPKPAGDSKSSGLFSFSGFGEK